MSVEALLVGMAMGITLITGLAIRSAMRGRPRRTSSDSTWPSAYATDASGDGGTFSSYSGSDDGSSGGDNCADTSDSGSDGGSDGGG
jgi:hypothetical protein